MYSQRMLGIRRNVFNLLFMDVKNIKNQESFPNPGKLMFSCDRKLGCTWRLGFRAFGVIFKI